ncbi:MAG TPA: hypothetical protein VMG34_02275 [Bacteroidota bacterium]|nr:hypothetical protein [Bacteroidota bacterium]
MPKRPIPIAIVGILFIVVGLGGIAFHASELNFHRLFEADPMVPLLIRLAAIVCGIFLLKGKEWARWGLVAWLLYHVGLSIFHSLPQVLVHIVVLGVVGYFLFRPSATAYLRRAR